MRIVNGYELPRVLVPMLAARLAITRAQIRTEVRRGNWQVLARGAVLTRPDEPTRADWAALGLAVGGRSTALTGWDGLRARGIGAPQPISPTVLLLTREGRSRAVGSAYIRRTDRPYATWSTSADHPTLPFARTVTPARAVVDAALLCSDLRTTRSLVTSAVQRRGCTLADVADELDAARRNGSRWLRQAVHDLGDGARSEAELVAARRLNRADIPAFELNVPVVDEFGRVIFVLDVLWRALRAGLEVDSRECHFSDAEWQATMARHNHLTRFGLSMTHYPPSRIVKRDDPWLSEVADWLHRRAVELKVPQWRTRGVLARVRSDVVRPFVVATGMPPARP